MELHHCVAERIEPNLYIYVLHTGMQVQTTCVKSLHKDDIRKRFFNLLLLLFWAKKRKKKSLRTFSVHFPRETLDSCLDSINTAVFSCYLQGFGPEWRVDTPTWRKKNTHVCSQTHRRTHTPQPMVKPHQSECFWPFMDIHIHPASEMKHHPSFLLEEKVTVEKKNK